MQPRIVNLNLSDNVVQGSQTLIHIFYIGNKVCIREKKGTNLSRIAASHLFIHFLHYIAFWKYLHWLPKDIYEHIRKRTFIYSSHIMLKILETHQNFRSVYLILSLL